MLGDHRKAFSSAAFTLAIAGIVLAISSIGLMTVFMMDSMVTDFDEDDLNPSGVNEHGPEYSVDARSSFMGALVLTVTDEDDDGWVWVRITLDGEKLQRLRNVSFPFMEQYPIVGSGEIEVTVIPSDGSGIDDLEVDISITGSFGLLSALTGASLAGPCCAAWMGSLVAGLIGLYIGAVRRREAGRWN